MSDILLRGQVHTGVAGFEEVVAIANGLMRVGRGEGGVAPPALGSGVLHQEICFHKR